MSCSPFDLKDYFFGEIDGTERVAVEQHLSTCAACRAEVQSLGLTRTALLSLPEEEPPRRIAFVSDKLFEPRWWQKLWASGPQLGFVSAALLAVAIVVHGVAQKPGVAPISQGAAGVQGPAIQAAVEAEVGKRLQPAIEQAVAKAESRRTAEMLEVVNQRLRQSETRHESHLLAIQEYLERTRKNDTVRLSRTMYETGVLQ